MHMVDDDDLESDIEIAYNNREFSIIIHFHVQYVRSSGPASGRVLEITM